MSYVYLHQNTLNLTAMSESCEHSTFVPSVHSLEAPRKAQGTGNDRNLNSTEPRVSSLRVPNLTALELLRCVPQLLGVQGLV